jgi:hypothetical protein
MKASLWVAAALLTAAGCSGEVRTTSQGDDLSSQRTTTSATLHTSKDDVLLEEGRKAAAIGAYTTAADRFTTVYQHLDAGAERRADALYHLGLVQSNLLNTKRDTQQAVATFRKLLDEFPKSKWRDDAEQALASLQKSARK